MSHASYGFPSPHHPRDSANSVRPPGEERLVLVVKIENSYRSTAAGRVKLHTQAFTMRWNP